MIYHKFDMRRQVENEKFKTSYLKIARKNTFRMKKNSNNKYTKICY